MTGPSDDPHGLDELLGAYALDAVDDDERRRVEEYLKINPRARVEVEEHREVASMLAFTGMDAPSGVWQQIVDELESAPPAPGRRLAELLDPADSIDEVGAQRSRSRSLIGRALTGVAAAVVIAVGAVVVFDRSADAPVDPVAAAYDGALADDRSTIAELRSSSVDAVAIGVIDPAGRGYLDAAALPALDDDLVYQFWGQIAGTDAVVSLGILGRQPGLQSFVAGADYSRLVITIESAPGVVSDGNPDGAFTGDLS